MNRRDLLNPTQLTFFDQLKALYERIDDAFIADLNILLFANRFQ